jgi:hypothetical protein
VGLDGVIALAGLQVLLGRAAGDVVTTTTAPRVVVPAATKDLVLLKASIDGVGTTPAVGLSK